MELYESKRINVQISETFADSTSKLCKDIKAKVLMHYQNYLRTLPQKELILKK